MAIPGCPTARAYADQARTKLPATAELGVGGELVPCDMPDERSLALCNTVTAASSDTSTGPLTVEATCEACQGHAG